MSDIAVSRDTDTAVPENSTPNPFAVRGFQKGFDPRRNTAGRIKKQPTVLDELAKRAHQAKHRKKIAAAWVEAAEDPRSAVAQRAREALSDRLYGLPKATLVLEQADSPLAALLAGLAADGALPYVDGEARVVGVPITDEQTGTTGTQQAT